MENVIMPVLDVQAANPVSSGEVIEARYGATLTSDVAAFGQSLERAENAAMVDGGPSAVTEVVFAQLDQINDEAANLIEYAQSAIESGNELTPSEIVMLSARSQEFMFHAQLTANVANRAADGMQQLFRQQS